MNLEDYLYELYNSGLYDEVMEMVGLLRQEDPYSDFKDIVEKAHKEVLQIKELKDNGGVA